MKLSALVPGKQTPTIKAVLRPFRAFAHPIRRQPNATSRRLISTSLESSTGNGKSVWRCVASATTMLASLSGKLSSRYDVTQVRHSRRHQQWLPCAYAGAAILLSDNSNDWLCLDSATGQFGPCALAGAPSSTGNLRNLSAGFVFEPVRNTHLTVDAYRIDIKGRVIESASLAGPLRRRRSPPTGPRFWRGFLQATSALRFLPTASIPARKGSMWYSTSAHASTSRVRSMGLERRI